MLSRSVVSNSLWCPGGPSVHGILQARILEWVAMPSSRRSSQPRNWTPVPPTLQADSLPSEPPGKPSSFLGASNKQEFCTYQYICFLWNLERHVLLFMSIFQIRVTYIKEVRVLVHCHTACEQQKDISNQSCLTPKSVFLITALLCFLVYGLMQLAIKHQNKYCIFFKASLFWMLDAISCIIDFFPSEVPECVSLCLLFPQ